MGTGPATPAGAPSLEWGKSFPTESHTKADVFLTAGSETRTECQSLFPLERAGIGTLPRRTAALNAALGVNQAICGLQEEACIKSLNLPPRPCFHLDLMILTGSNLLSSSLQGPKLEVLPLTQLASVAPQGERLPWKETRLYFNPS